MLNATVLKYSIAEIIPFESISDKAKIEVCKKVKSKCKINVVGACTGMLGSFPSNPLHPLPTLNQIPPPLIRILTKPNAIIQSKQGNIRLRYTKKG